jgi:hypothetical protein
MVIRGKKIEAQSSPEEKRRLRKEKEKKINAR